MSVDQIWMLCFSSTSSYSKRIIQNRFNAHCYRQLNRIEIRSTTASSHLLYWIISERQTKMSNVFRQIAIISMDTLPVFAYLSYHYYKFPCFHHRHVNHKTNALQNCELNIVILMNINIHWFYCNAKCYLCLHLSLSLSPHISMQSVNATCRSING